VIPKTDRGIEICGTFVLGGIGYDLWPISWKRMERIAAIATPITSILMDSKVVFYAANADLARYMGLREKVDLALKDDHRRLKISRRKLQRLQSGYLELLLQEDERHFVRDSIQFAEDSLILLATLNGCYVKKGLYNVEQEILDYSEVPAGFQDGVAVILENKDRRAVLSTIENLLCEMRDIVLGHRSDRANFDPNKLRGYYEETKSIYNRLLRACAEKNYFRAMCASKTIDEELEALVPDAGLLSKFPSMLTTTRGKDYGRIEEACRTHEQKLLELCESFRIPIARYTDLENFERSF
jgi:hypothetical protein